jgi:hypothetical protein
LPFDRKFLLLRRALPLPTIRRLLLRIGLLADPGFSGLDVHADM